MLDLNRSPYYDDYDEEKKFHRILYRPTYAVQARELTQQQTILQNQIERFGDHIFKNGSMVIPGQVSFDNGLHYAKLQTTYDGFEIDETAFIGYVVEGLTSGAKAEVVLTSGIEGTDPKTFYLKYTDAGTGNYESFIDGETLQRVDNTIFKVNVLGDLAPETFNNVGVGSATSIDDGVYYVSGNFVVVDAQTIIVSKYDNTPTAKIGLQLYEYLITPEDDATLVDNAQGSYNYAAPGAHRYKLDLKLETYEIGAIVSDDFIELQRIEGGKIINEIRTATYNEIEKTMARRTFDESGNYTVRPFNISIREHLLDPNVERLKTGKYTAAKGGDETKLALGIEPGLAYVRGFERLTLDTQWINSNKARTTATNNNSVVNFDVGQWIYITRVFQLPYLSTYVNITLRNAATVTDGTGAGSSIGTAKARAIELVDTSGTSDLHVYKLYIFDIQLDAGSVWSDVLSISATDSNLSAKGILFTCNTTVGGDYAGMDLIVNEPTKKTSVFKMPHDYIKTLKPGGTSDTTYTVLRTYPIESTSGGIVTLSAGSNSVFNAFSGFNYIVQDLDATTSALSFIELTSGDVTLVDGGVSVIIDCGAGVNDVRIIAPVVKQVANEKVKTSQSRIITINGPNIVPGGIDLLDRADGIELVAVLDLGNASEDITDRYNLDNGQRDAFYDLARIKLNTNAVPPVGNLSVEFTYYSHGAGDYCSVDSYSGVDYVDIPVFVSDADTYDLADSFDFRPLINSAGTDFTGATGAYGELPSPKSNIRSDYEHYLSRIDKVFIDYTGLFDIIEGNPDIVPEPPQSPDDGMVLFEMTMDPYTVSPSAAKAKFIENKRYTMRDIGGLEKRIGNLEYYTALSLLEKETAQFQIKDDLGFDRFKNGFIVDPFNSHATGESASLSYRCSIDPTGEKMRPTFDTDSIDLVFNESKSANVRRTGPLVTLPYTDQAFITQGLASTSENINPFSVRSYIGIMTFTPDSDNWYDTKNNGTIVVNDDANYAALEYMAQNSVGLTGTSWNSWQDQWSSSSSKVISSSSATRSSTRRRGRTATTTNTTTTTSLNATTTSVTQGRTGTWTGIQPTTVTKNLGDRTVGMNYIPFMRTINVTVKTDNMKPNTIVYPFFDDVDVAAHCVPAPRATVTSLTGNFITKYGSEEIVTTLGGGSAKIMFISESLITVVSWNGSGFNSGDTVTGSVSGASCILTEDLVYTATGDPLVTDDHGRQALVFTIPNSDDLRFRTGERTFLLTDQVNNTKFNQTKAKGVFRSEGALLQQESTVLSTKTIRFNEVPVTQKRTITNTTLSTSTSVSRSRTTESFPRTWSLWNNNDSPNGNDDPLSQTFFINEDGGAFITKCDIYFKDKDKENRPVIFQIREVVNGYPGAIIAPYSETVLYPADITTSQDGSVATTFEMQAPVFLQQGQQYCLVLLTDSFDYNVWIGEVGQTDIISGNLISKQPHNGVLFKSQNASTWNASQQQDLKFNMFKARFKIETTEGSGVLLFGNTILENDDLPEVTLELNPVETLIGDSYVIIHQKDHGFSNGSTQTITGIVGPINGIPDTEINGTHTISKATLDTYQVDTTTAGTANGRGGGAVVTGATNKQMDLIRPNISELLVPGSSSLWEIKTTSGKSINGTQTPYVFNASYSTITTTENNFFTNPRMIASPENETNFLAGKKSLELQNVIYSNNRNVSPVLDLNRASAIIVANRIESPTTITATKGINTTAGSQIITVSHTDHGLATGAGIDVVAIVTIGSVTAAEMTGSYIITRTGKDSYTFEVVSTATVTTDSGAVDITYSDSHYKYVPENMSDGTAAAKYFTRKVTVEEEAVSLKILATATVMDPSEFEVWYRKQGTSNDSVLFTDIDWVQIEDPDTFVALSENIDDYKDYEFTKEFDAADGFTSIAVKLVMKSTDSSRAPIFDNLRVICLGT